MAAIADRIGDNLRRAGIDFDGKPFKSHITVGRCRGPADLSGFFERFSGSDFTEFQCDEILVMRSVLGPSGAKHTVLRRIPLIRESTPALSSAGFSSKPASLMPTGLVP